MARTRNSYIPVGIASRGLAIIAPLAGEGRASRGYVGDYPGGVVPPDTSVLAPAALLSTTSLDSSGTPRLINNDIQSLWYWEAGQDVFANPDKEFSGYGATGFWYTNGVLDPTHLPFQASWASEAQSLTRGTLGRFPVRILIAATRGEVVIFDADTLDVWMRFEIGTVVPPANQGKFAGQPTTLIRSIAYADGVLLAATNEGLKAADFRRDRGFNLAATPSEYGESDTDPTVGGLAQRNVDSFIDYTALIPFTLYLLTTDCLDVSINTYSYGKDDAAATTRGSMTVAAVGSVEGVTALSFVSTTVPYAMRHSSSRILGGWEVEDDLDPDAFSPYFIDYNFGATNWLSLGVRAGDRLVTDIGTTHTIVKVEQAIPGSRLILTPEMPVTATGAAYTIWRGVSVVHVASDLTLYISDGPNAIAKSSTLNWFKTPGAASPQGLWTPATVGGSFADCGMVWAADLSETAALSTQANDMARRGDITYLATDIGVAQASDDDLDGGRKATLLYSTTALTDYDAEYKILQGTETNVSAISVDPETGNITVAVTDFESVVTEINPNIEQAFRFYDNVGRVRALVAYRNPKGPPDVSVT